MQIINPENPTVVLGGEEYEVSKMTDNGKYYVDQIQDLYIQTNQLQAKSHQIEVARVGFVSLLKAELEAQERIFAGGEDEDGSEEAPAEEAPAE